MKRALPSVEYEGQKEATAEVRSDSRNNNGFQDEKAASINDGNGYKHQRKNAPQAKQLPHFLQLLMTNSKYVGKTPSAGNASDSMPRCYYCEIPLENDSEKLRCCRCHRFACHLRSGCSIRDKNDSLFCLECFSAA